MSMKRNSAAHLMTIACVLAAGGILLFILPRLAQPQPFTLANGGGTRFDFISSSGSGFHREVPIYTEDGITSIAFTGKITVEGSADILIRSADDGQVFYQQTYTDMREQDIQLLIKDLAPYSHYTLHFTSDDAAMGNLALTTAETLAKYPERPERPARSPA